MQPTQSKAFTLIEAIIAIVILSVAVPSMVFAVRQSHDKRVSPVLASRARWLATSLLEDIIADRHGSSRGYAYLKASNYPAQADPDGYVGFNRSVAFTETGADLTSPGVGYMRADVTVSWTDAAGAVRSLTLSSILTDYTP